MEKHELLKVEAHIQAIKAADAVLADSGDSDELWRIIHQPGWTTVAEAAFLVAALESISAQTRQLTNLRVGLLAAAKQVNTGRAAGA
ncbi:MAG TPA: hypothetical protein VJN93_08460 [Candidatus Acidoferrum sp.]|nr:hypothetical protein [Candidatus Acidoferrum sp.]